MAVGYPQDVLFSECAWNSVTINCSQHITEVFDPNYGKCFLFNVSKWQNLAGTGLSLVLNLDTKHALPSMPAGQSIKYDMSLYDGVILKVRLFGADPSHTHRR